MRQERSTLTLRAYSIDPETGLRQEISRKRVRPGKGKPDDGVWPPCACAKHRAVESEQGSSTRAGTTGALPQT